jgi:hypothetical protein
MKRGEHGDLGEKSGRRREIVSGREGILEEVEQRIRWRR